MKLINLLDVIIMFVGLGLSTKRPIGTYLRIADVADVAGFNTFWIPDMNPSSPYLEQYVTLSAVVAITERMMIGPGVSNPYSRHPAMIARAIATLYDLSNGRVFLGFGAGGALALKPLGFPLWDQPYRSVLDAVESIKKLLAGETVTVKSKYFTIDSLSFNKEPKRDVPIYIGARSPNMLRLAGKIADGVVLSSSIEYIELAKKYIQEGLNHRNRKMEDFKIINWVPSAFAKRPDESYDMVKLRVATYLLYHPISMLKKINFDIDRLNEIRVAFNRGERDIAKDLVSEKMINKFSICGSTKEILSKISAFKDAGVSEIVFGDPFSENEIVTINELRKSLLPIIKKI